MIKKSNRNIEFIIEGGLIFDGTGRDPFIANIGISGDKIAFINKKPINTSSTRKVIKAEGLIVAPGFIDCHGHSEFTLVADPRAEGKLYQGVTTEINGNCGFSAAPLKGDALIQREKDFIEYGIDHRWKDFKDYFKIIDKRIAINFATLIGHGNLRASTMGYKNKAPTNSNINQMKAHILKALNEGALGISLGLAYPPGVYSDTRELIELSNLLAKNRERCSRKLNKSIISEEEQTKGILSSHIRNEGDKLEESIREMIMIGKKSKVRIHISHIKTEGKKNWHKIDKVISMIEDAQREGIQITCDRYPYIASSTDLDSILPSWVYEGGINEEIKRLRNANIREKIKKEIIYKNTERDFWDNIIIASTFSGRNKWAEGKNITFIANKKHENPIDTFFKILLEERVKVTAIFKNMSEDNLRRFLALPYVMLGTDSAVRSKNGPTDKGKPHPRGFGSFPRFIGRYIRDRGLIDLSNAIKKITLLPTQTFGIKNRGIIKEGAFADIVVFDYKNIIDNATFNNPFQKSKGIKYVFINGLPALWDGKTTGILAGRIIRY